MKENRILVAASVISVLFFTLHLASDIVYGIEKGDLSNLPAIPMAVVWLCGALLLAERRSGHIIMLLGAILGSGIPVLHMRGRGLSRIAKLSGGFFFSWTLIALGVTALLSLILSVRGLWTLRRGEPR